MLVLSREVDQTVVIGEGIFVSPTDIDSKSARIIARGRMLGGPSDGGTFTSTHELARGQSFGVGPMITVTLVDIVGNTVRLGINVPKHLSIHRKEVVDQMKRQQGASDGGGAEERRG